MEMCVPFTSFQRSYQFQAIHGHILNFSAQNRTRRGASGLALNGKRFSPDRNFQQNFRDFLVNEKRPLCFGDIAASRTKISAWQHSTQSVSLLGHTVYERITEIE